ncbi:sugar transferase [Sinomicrobium soli]|uniref:sugar transferase n=1 Tax=Sinomicrobium sp. N-1-3-6 TaxID=2219864 RepID=UPI000DCE19A3|nr:sugar transferase [Sinomicrobium sp. N-1-3-6]RAV30981.1 hypothetical protein DN748_01680 [Sinomicrobium sp. N-1-3-6]
MYKYIKVILDFLLAILILLCIFPFLIPVIVVLYFHFDGKPFFKQKRVGYKNMEFYIFKLKTMKDLYDEKGNSLPDRDRITKIGSFIRKLSLDELPQILNVLKNEMSFVGPRPLSPKLMPYYSEKELLRHQVKPGITGLAQINGRNSLNWDERLAFDVEYYEKISFVLDIKIIWETVLNVLQRKDISVTPQIPSLIKTRDPNTKTVNDT